VQTTLPLNFEETIPAFDLSACRALMRGGSKSFFAASLLLPARLRAPATALYAFCRLADDAIDMGSDAHAAMRDLKARLDSIYGGRPGALDADRALAHVVHRFSVPRSLLDALLEGFLWDAQGRLYQTLEEVEDYGARVAGTVGAMMSLIMDTRSKTALARACELGVAMQLTNIARDIGEDARNGRLYIPRNWFVESGMDADAWLRNPVFDDRIAGFTARLLERAHVLYKRGAYGVGELPWDCRPAIQAARLVYAEIGYQLQRQGLDSVNHRTVVSKPRKLYLIARATAVAVNAPYTSPRELHPLPCIAFLVQAVTRLAHDHPAGSRHGTIPERNFDQRVEWMVDLFERLEQKDRFHHYPPPSREAS
jgi:phytoene synthase